MTRVGSQRHREKKIITVTNYYIPDLLLCIATLLVVMLY